MFNKGKMEKIENIDTYLSNLSSSLNLVVANEPSFFLLIDDNSRRLWERNVEWNSWPLLGFFMFNIMLEHYVFI